MYRALNLAENSFTEAFDREKVHAPQDLPVGFRYGRCTVPDSVIVEAQSE